MISRSICILIFILLITPLSFARAALRINEIAWQGYLGDANNEWIELYNDGGESLTLDGWLLEADDGTPSINLSGITVSPSGFVLLERTDDSTVPEETADKFYSGALSNEGEYLRLKNADGTVIDSANFSSGWNDMTSDSPYTLSFFGSGWGTGLPTPKAGNESSGEDTNDEDTEDDSSEETVQASTSASTSNSEKKEVTYKERTATIEAEKFAFVGVPFLVGSFLRDLDGDEIRKGFYAWNMGDGSVIYKAKNEDFTYTYKYPGEYVISLSYYRSNFGQDPEDLKDSLIYDEHIVTVSDKSLSFESYSGGAVTLKNNSAHTMNIENWVITNNDVRFVVPKKTMVRAGKTITFHEDVTKFKHNPIFIFNPAGSLVDYSHELSKTESSSGTLASSRDSSSAEQSASSVDESDSYPAFEEELLSLENNFESARDQVSASVPNASSTTLYVFLFVLILLVSGFVVWVLLSSKEKNTVVEGYEIIED